MSQEARLSCRCGQVEGVVSDATPERVMRVVCYCDDCQAFAHHLGRADLLDAQGGADIVQVAPAALRFTRGAEHLRVLRLAPRGLLRGYTACCNTPLGNSVGPALPFVGLPAAVFAGNAGGADALFGRPRGAIQGKFAIGAPPPGSTDLNLGLLVQVGLKILGWRLRGRAWPHPFLARGSAAPTVPVQILSEAERAALRPRCGPRPAA